jgi:hypothetical protein
MVSDHEKDIAEFQQYVDEGKDPDLASFAGRPCPR